MSRISEQILSKLKQVEEAEQCRVLLAVESGSRAWGFASQDSDYDVRFLYLRPYEWYLSIRQGRDVIERDVDEHDIDLSGWDLLKGLRLLAKSNPPLLEWLQSPTVYLERFSAAGRLRRILPEIYSPKACMHHYLHMAEGNFREYLQGEEVRVKKYFYVIRPVLACRWIEAGLGPVPMEFDRLLEKAADDGSFKDEVRLLLEEKRAGAELGRGPRRPLLNEFLNREIRRLSQWRAETSAPGAADISALDLLFREALDEVWGGKPAAG